MPPSPAPEASRSFDPALAGLIAAGIPSEFHSRTATLEPYAAFTGVPELRTALNTRETWHRTTITIYDGKQKAGARIAYLTARAMVLRELAVKCFTLPKLVDAVQNNERALVEKLSDECDVIVVLGFCEPNVCETNPYDKALVHRMEWFLTGQLMKGRAFVLHSTSQGMMEWWSPRLVNAMTENRIVEVKA